MSDSGRLDRLERALRQLTAIMGDVLDVEGVEALLGEVRPAEGVLVEVGSERVRQDLKFGGPSHDDEHDLDYWASLIESRAGQVRHESDPREVRRLLVESAACSVAAVEWLDRIDQGDPDGV